MFSFTKSCLVGLFVCFSGTLGLTADAETATPHREVSELFADTLEAYQAEDFQRSLAAATEALRILQSQSAIAYNNICSAEMRLEHYDLAIGACRKALELDPGFGRARNNLAWTYESLAARTPTTGVYLNLSELRYWQGDLDASIAASERALELEPGNAIAHNNLCAAYAKDERWSSAVRECEKALKANPDYPLAQNNLNWAKSRQLPAMD